MKSAWQPDRTALTSGATGPLVAPGTARPHSEFRKGEKRPFAGAGSLDPNERDITEHETILTGDLAEDDGVGFVGNSENSYHVISMVRSFARPVVDGCTIMGGNADDIFENPGGGGAWISDGSADFVNCIFRGNSAVLLGGAIYNDPGHRSRGDTLLKDCVFERNRSGGDGGAVTSGGSALGRGITVIDCTFVNNTAQGSGGAIYLGPGTVTGCAFIGNTATFEGGGVANSIHGGPSFVQCEFIQNTASHGGGIFFRQGTSVVDCGFFDNTAVRGGGAYSFFCGLRKLVHCTFTGNSAREGGGLFLEGLICDNLTALVGCSFLGNSARVSGGAIWNGMGKPSFVNCVIAGNSALSSGGGFFNSVATVADVGNCTIAANVAGEGGGLFNADGSRASLANSIVWGNIASWNAQLAVVGSAELMVTHTDVEDGWPGEGNLNVEPLFISPQAGDYRVRPHSPCVDAGDNSAVPADEFDLDGDGDVTEPIPLDLAGRPRFRNQPNVPDTGNAAGLNAVVDMGAFEAPGRPGDIDGNGVVNLADFALFARCFGLSASGASCAAVEFAASDLTDDGSINLVDFATFAANFGG